MAGKWDDWLRVLARAGKNAGYLLPAVRGKAWNELVEIEGDWTGATLAGAIRSEPDAGSVLATFTVSGPTVSAGYSVWEVSLASGAGANSTGALPLDGDADGVEDFPAAFYLTPAGGEQELLFGGVFSVAGLV